MVKRSPASGGGARALTAWGVWVAAQGRGVLQDAQFATGVAYSTLHYAKTRLVTAEIAEQLQAYSKGAVKKAAMTRPRRQRVRSRSRSRKAAA